MPELFNVTIPEYQDNKSALVKVATEDGNMHYSWEDVNGQVVSFEHCPANYPSTSLSVWPSKQAYFDIVVTVDWIASNLPEDHEAFKEDEEEDPFAIPSPTVNRVEYDDQLKKMIDDANDEYDRQCCENGDI